MFFFGKVTSLDIWKFSDKIIDFITFVAFRISYEDTRMSLRSEFVPTRR